MLGAIQPVVAPLYRIREREALSVAPGATDVNARTAGARAATGERNRDRRRGCDARQRGRERDQIGARGPAPRCWSGAPPTKSLQRDAESRSKLEEAR
jgi:hypothetical protein